MTRGGMILAGSAGIAVVTAVSLGVLSYRAGVPGATAGVVAGSLLGALGSVLELVLVRRALKEPRGAALRIVLGGFLARLALLVGLSLAFQATGIADGASFALCFLTGFLASIPMLAVAVAGRPSAPTPEARA